jgi:flavin reductase (DIM6/NTAB) family NADH-FMN oxidoreductase RutF
MVVILMKKRLGAKNCLYPTLTVLVGAMVNEKPNFITIAHVGIMTMNAISLGINKKHFTNAGIKKNNAFSVNIPSENLIKETDYCGIVSGKDVDKSSLFDIFYGELKTAPMITECPINMECRLVKTVDFPSHDVFVGEVVATYCNEEILTEGLVDIAKLKPLLFEMHSIHYWSLGERLAKCWNIGKELKE